MTNGKEAMDGELKTAQGFSLVEVVVALALLIILAAGLLQSIVAVTFHFRAVDRQREEILRKWNASRRLRLELPSTPNRVLPREGTRALYRHQIEPLLAGGFVWEVWLGER